MLQNNASDDHAGRAIIHIGVCPQNISVSASSFFPCSLSLLLVLSHQCLLITYIFLACWDLSIIWGFWALVEQKTSLSLQCTLGFFYAIFIFSMLFSVFSSLYPSFAFKSSSVLFKNLPSSPRPCCLSACSNHCFFVCVANNCLWWIWSCSLIIYENCALSSLLRCFPCDFIWLNTGGDFGKAGRNRRDPWWRQTS